MSESTTRSGIGDNAETANWRVHSLYWIGILLALLIGTLSVRWNNVEGLPEIISFALSFASFVLAVVAIFQALSSSSSLTHLLSSLNRSSEDIEKSSITIENSAETIRTSADSVVSATQSHATVLTEVGDKIIRQKDGVSGEGAQPAEPKVGSLTIKDTSNGGRVAIYLAAKTVGSGKLVQATEIDGLSKTLANYLDGYNHALIVEGHVKAKWEGARYEITDLGVNKNVLLGEIREKFLSNEDHADRLIGMLDAIDNFFLEKPRNNEANSDEETSA